ncbi:Rhodopirellula transposase family protein [mine drainage metagenome]|uniref:Rhodopirellula transposase family protein n=2 Tax=mine drainage metagenome TaxID=410659 RepID=T1BDB8_9ZZZZ
MKITPELEKHITVRYKAISWTLDERMRRLWAAAEAMAMGHGGIVAVARITGVSQRAIQAGLKELEAQEFPDPDSKTDRIRRPGGGPKALTEKYPGLIKALESLVEPGTRGDPMSPLRWTTKSLRSLASELGTKGYKISHVTVGDLLKELGYSLQANEKTLQGKEDHPDRDAQFEFINSQAEKAMEEGNPVISVDAKKKELVGLYKNAGQTWEPKGEAVEVNDHDFPDKELGRVTPYGVYDVQKNEGWVNVGTDHDTASFAVESIRRWWTMMGRESYPHATELVITADGGGSNASRSRLFKVEIQNLANELGLPVRISHFPPGTSKWNKIEHRLFSHISMNWKGHPLTSHEVIVNLIANTRTRKGLTVKAGLDKTLYPLGVKVPDEQMNALNIQKNTFHGEWNYTVSPESK